jgi:hypothetical protein
MKKAILISGKPATGKTTMAIKIATAIEPNKYNWLSCSTVTNMKLRPNTKVVIAEVPKLEVIEQFIQYIGEPIHVHRKRGKAFEIEAPFFIFQSQLITSLPDELKWNKRFAHFHLANFYHGVFQHDCQDGDLPPQVIKTMNEEMGERRSTRLYCQQQWDRSAYPIQPSQS